MYIVKVSLLLLAITLHSAHSYGQQDTSANTPPSITKVPLQFIKQTNLKIDKYTHRISSKTEKTLVKLTKWENKIQQLLQKTSPQTAQQLFGEGKLSFATMLQKIQQGKAVVENTKARYNEYNDKLITNIKYLETQQAQLDDKYIKPLQAVKGKIKELENEVTETEAIEKIIKERKKELLTEAYKVLGKSKYLTKINKEAYYYTETLRNYKQIFNEPAKAEKLAYDVLNKIPAVKDFVQKNSMLANLFGNPSPLLASPTGGGTLGGLQTRVSVNTLIQNQLAAAGPNAAAQIRANMQAAQAELTKIKDKILKATNGNASPTVEGEDGLPSFKKKEVKSKTFKQRLELGSNMQFGKPNKYTSSQADIAMSVGYKINDKSIAGIGLSYKLNYGAIDNFYLQHGGVGVRSFVDWKLKKQFYLSGGYEMNYNSSFKNFKDLMLPQLGGRARDGLGSPWQSSGLIGFSKKINLSPPFGGSKGGRGLVKATTIQILYDLLYNTHAVPTQPVVFRVGYKF